MHEPQILFVCSASRIRSRTAELLAFSGGYPRDEAGKQKTIYLCRSAGTDPKCPSPVTNNGMVDAEVVVCMEQEHADYIAQFQAAEQVRIVTLGIQDVYLPFEKALVDELVARLHKHGLQQVATAIESGLNKLRNNMA